MPDIVLLGIGKTYPGAQPTVALRQVDLTVRQGEFVAIEGPSGGGKSTLLNIVGLLDTPSAGQYLLDGTDLAHESERTVVNARSDHFAFIFQSFHLLDRRPVVDSVELGLLYRGLTPRLRRAKAIAALESLNIGHLAHQTANKLSGGERQRVAIARALAVDAPVVVADEPTGNLDSRNGRAVVEALELFHRRGASVVLVTHSPETAAVAQRRVSIADGVLADPAVDHQPSPPQEMPSPPGHAATLRSRDLLFDAVASIRSRVLRSLSLLSAVAVGVALAIATIGISVSADAQVSNTFNAHTNRDVSISWPLHTLDDETSQQRRTIPARLDQLAGVDSAAMSTNDGEATVDANPDRTAIQVTVYGESGQYVAASRSSVRWAEGHRHAISGGEALVGQTLAAQLGLGPLEAQPDIAVDGVTVTVVGLIRASPRIPDAVGSVVLPQSRAATFTMEVQQQALILTSEGAAQQVARQAPLVVDPYRADQLQVSAPTDPSTLRAQVQNDVQVTLAVFTAVAVAASIAGLINTTMLGVLERRQEFGLRRAVGARARHIFALVLAESAILGLLGGFAGFIAGVAAVLAVTLANHWGPVFDFRIAPLAVFGGLLVGSLGGIAASIRAARIRPSEALRA